MTTATTTPADPTTAPQTSQAQPVPVPDHGQLMLPLPPPASRLPGPCPVCGAHSLDPATRSSILLAVCDVLTVKALERMGDKILRVERARYRKLGDRPLYLAHTLWTPDEKIIRRATKNAWDAVPPLVTRHAGDDTDPHRLTLVLDSYVRALVQAGTPHDVDALAGYLSMYLGFPLVPEGHHDADA